MPGDHWRSWARRTRALILSAVIVVVGVATWNLLRQRNDDPRVSRCIDRELARKHLWREPNLESTHPGVLAAINALCNASR